MALPTGRTWRHPTRRLGIALLCLGSLACFEKGPELVRRPGSPPAALLVRHVAILDVESGRIEPDRDLLLKGDRIAAIGPGGALPVEPGAEVIDGAGAVALPGLIDSHAHLMLHSGPVWQPAMPDVEANLRAYLYAGVTTVLDPGDSSPDALERRDRVARGDVLGPRIYSAGKLVTSPGGHPIPMIEATAPWWLSWYIAPRAAVQVDSPEQARAAAAARAAEGVDFLKLVVDRIPEDATRLDVDSLEAAVEEAHEHGLRAIAHIGDVRDALESGRAGVSAWMHTVYKERIPDQTIGKLASFGIPMVPTLVVWHSYADLLVKSRQPTRLERETAPSELLASFDPVPEELPMLDTFGPYLEMLRQQQPHWSDNVRRLHEAGVTMLAGSDAQSGVFPGAGLHREIGLLHQAGLSRAEAIRAATLDAARFLTGSEDPDFGSVRVGKRADLLIVNRDPTQDIGALSDIRDVVLGGVRLIRTPIDAR